MNKMTKAIANSFLGLVGLGLVLSATDVSFAARDTSYVKVNIDRKDTNSKNERPVKDIPQEIIPPEEVIAPEVVAPEIVAPEEIVPEVLLPEEIAPEVIAPEIIAPEEIAPEEIAPEVVVLEEIVYDASVYSEELEYVKLCLNNLGFTDSNGMKLTINGYFDRRVEFALSNFLTSQGFESFNEQSRDALFKEAEYSVNNDYDSGFNSTSSTLDSTAFIYSDVANVDNKWDPFYSMGVLKNFENIVTSRPDQISYNAKKVMDYVKSNTNVFGYVNLGPNNPASIKADWILADLDEVKSQIDEIADAGWYGVFIDQFGYDWGETRERQNIIIDHAHSRGLSVMANAWFPKDALGSEIHKSGNPNGISSNLNSNDWSLVESFFTDGNSYRADSSYIEKYLQSQEYSKDSGVKISALSYKRDSITWEESQNDIETSYVLSHILGFDGWWFGRWDNSNNFLYGKEPNIDLGSVIKPLTLESSNKYVAETENYIIEYFSDAAPSLNLIKK